VVPQHFPETLPHPSEISLFKPPPVRQPLLPVLKAGGGCHLSLHGEQS
jgi:hypothetical protein